MTYQLASLDLATDFDRPLAPLTVPGKAVKGDSAGLVLLDGAARGAYRLARLVRQEALLGLSVTRPDLPVDVHLVLVVDAFSDDMWRRSRDLEEDAVVPRRHRLARVSVQGRQRAAVLLEPAPLDGSVASQRLTVRVRPEELGSGLLTLGFDVPREVPSWLGGAVLEDGLTGVCIARVSLEPATETLTGSLSTGFAGSKRRRLVPRYPGGFVVNPAPAGRTDVVLRPRVLEQRPRPVGRRALAREPLARVRDGAARVRVRRHVRAVTEVVSVTSGRRRQVLSDARPDGTFVVALEPGEGPVYARPRLLRTSGGESRMQDWYCWVDGSVSD